MQEINFIGNCYQKMSSELKIILDKILGIYFTFSGMMTFIFPYIAYTGWFF